MDPAITTISEAPASLDGTVPTTMRAVTARTYGGPEVLAVEELPVPRPGDGQILVHIAASSLNALDWHFVTGTPYFMRVIAGLRRPKRVIPGADVAGTVAAVGSGVDDFAVGDRVFGETNGGGFAHYGAFKTGEIAHLPAGVTFEAAGATPVAGLTAIQALRTHADVQPGESVLINGAAGGVGTFAVQIAKALGGRVTAVCSGRKVEMIRALGADRVIDYTKEDFVAIGERYDVMMDNVGNRKPAECMQVLKPTARYVVVSGPKKNRWLGPVPSIIRSALAFRRTDISFHQFTAHCNRDDLDLLGAMLADGRVVPQIDRVVGFGGAANGLTEIGSGHARAKIVVKPDATH